jgi:hypothetical protein
MKTSNDPNGNRTRDLPACSTVPPHTPTVYKYVYNVTQKQISYVSVHHCIIYRNKTVSYKIFARHNVVIQRLRAHQPHKIYK